LNDVPLNKRVPPTASLAARWSRIVDVLNQTGDLSADRAGPKGGRAKMVAHLSGDTGKIW
jgi:hypothetical protein